MVLDFVRLGRGKTYFVDVAVLRLMQNCREVEAFCFVVFDCFGDAKRVTSTDHVFEFSEAKLRHNLADFLGDKEHKAREVFGLAGKTFSQFGVLGCDTVSAGAFVTFSKKGAA